MIVGLILVVVGIIALLSVMGVITGSVWSYVWPIILIVIGLSLLFGWRRKRGWRHWCCGPDNEEKK